MCFLVFFTFVALRLKPLFDPSTLSQIQIVALQDCSVGICRSLGGGVLSYQGFIKLIGLQYLINFIALSAGIFRTSRIPIIYHLYGVSSRSSDIST